MPVGQAFDVVVIFHKGGCYSCGSTLVDGFDHEVLIDVLCCKHLVLRLQIKYICSVEYLLL